MIVEHLKRMVQTPHRSSIEEALLAWTVRSTPGHGSARLLPWRLSLTRLTEDQLSDPKGDLNVLLP